MNYTVNIDARAAVVFTNKLEKLHKSALPNAIRNTLNRAAFDVKMNTMPASAEKNFVKRKPNLFKANNKVFMAQGWDVNTMRATVAFTPQSAAYNNFAVRELEEQENSGVIGNRSFVPLPTSRSNNTNSGQVLPSNRLSVIKKIVDSSNSSGRSKKEQFIKAALYAGRGGFVIGNTGSKTLFKITSVKRDGQSTIIKKTPLYSFAKGRSVRITKATHFMRTASFKTSNEIYKFYQQESTRQLNRLFK